MGLSFARPFAIAAVAVGMLGAAVGCSSGSGNKPVSLLPGAAGAVSTTVAPGAAGGATGAGGAPTSVAGGPPPGGPATTAGRASSTTSTAKPASSTPATAPKAPGAGSTGPAPAAPGTYHYAVSGTSVLTTGTTSTTLAVPSTSTLVVSATGAGAQQWVGASTTSNFVFTGTGVFLTSETVPLASTTCTFGAPVASPPWPVAVGKSFSGQATCGSGSSASTLSVQGRVSGTASVSVGGAPFSTYLVQTTLTLAGTSLVVAETDWYSPALRLPVKSVVIAQGGIAGYSINSTTTYTLTSAVPS